MKIHIVVGTDKVSPDPDKARTWCGRWIHQDNATLDIKQATCVTCIKARAVALGSFREIIRDRIGI